MLFTVVNTVVYTNCMVLQHGIKINLKLGTFYFHWLNLTLQIV